MSAQQYIYNADAEEAFYKKLEGLHDKYVYHLLLNGVADKGTDLESIKMTKNLNANKKYCERVVGGFLNIKPQVIVRLLEDNEVRLECIFTRIDDKETLNHVYMIQNIMDWPELGKFSCQIWYLGETGIYEIDNHWNNT